MKEPSKGVINGNGHTPNGTTDASAAEGADSKHPNGYVRTTLVLPAHLYWTVAAWCANQRIRKGDGVLELIKAGLIAKGLKPDKAPKEIKIVY